MHGGAVRHISPCVDWSADADPVYACALYAVRVSRAMPAGSFVYAAGGMGGGGMAHQNAQQLQALSSQGQHAAHSQQGMAAAQYVAMQQYAAAAQHGGHESVQAQYSAFGSPTHYYGQEHQHYAEYDVSQYEAAGQMAQMNQVAFAANGQPYSTNGQMAFSPNGQQVVQSPTGQQ